MQDQIVKEPGGKHPPVVRRKIMRNKLRRPLTLLLSAVLFFGVYGGVLTILKESFVWEMEQQFFGKAGFLFRNKKER